MEFADWTRAFVMMGDSPAGVREVLLAADGSMYALLQGEDALGALHTVRLDDQGRMSAFVIDSTDAWGQMLSIGNAELAARLEALMSYDRRGLYQFGTAFERGLTGWDTTLSGTNAAAATTPITFERGGYSIKLTGGSSTEWSAMLFRRVSLLTSERVGIEVGLSLGAVIDSVEIGADYYDASQQHTALLRYDDVANELQVYEPGPAWTMVRAAYALPTGIDTFNVLKVVFDTVTDKYVRAVVNGVEYDLSAYDLVTGPAPPSAWIKPQVKVISRNLVNDVVYVDHVIITNQEPTE